LIGFAFASTGIPHENLKSQYPSLYKAIVMRAHPYPVPDSKITGAVFWKGSWADEQADLAPEIDRPLNDDIDFIAQQETSERLKELPNIRPGNDTSTTPATTSRQFWRRFNGGR
jgi:hypothetical protein